MNFFEILKQFKKIEPDPQFTEKSKRMILATPQNSPVSGTLAARGFRAFFQILETSAAFVLVGFFILLITGGFPGSKYLAPVQYSVIDPQGLHAEAQAVDMQIELANITYPESATPVSTPTMAVATSGATSSLAVVTTSTATSSPSAANASGTASSTASSTLSIDQALRELSQ
jgi:hypothetical protein